MLVVVEEAAITPGEYGKSNILRALNDRCRAYGHTGVNSVLYRAQLPGVSGSLLF